jgi:transcriptional regulator with XRE-family HTH domain
MLNGTHLADEFNIQHSTFRLEQPGNPATPATRRRGVCTTLHSPRWNLCLTCPYDPQVTFSEVLQREFDRRRAANRRYSLRAFARSLRIHHSTLSQLLRGRRRVTTRTIRILGQRIAIAERTIFECCAAANDAAVLAAIRRPSFQPSSRWIASMSGITLDDVNISLQRLIYNGVVVMATPSEWRVNG